MAKKFSTFAPKMRAALLAVLISTLLLAIFAAVSCKNSGGLFGKGVRASAGAAAGGSDSEFGENGGLSPIPHRLTARFVSIEAALGEIETAEIPSDVDAGIFDTLRAELVRQLRERSEEYGGRIPAAAPVGDAGRVTDLEYDPETNLLSWSYVNKGDYDLSGDVGIPDITPIALNYGKSVSYDIDGKPSGDIGTPEGLVNHRLAWIDGDGNGEIGISDITPIALSYLNEINRYLIVTSEEVEGQFSIIGQPVPLVAEMVFPVKFDVELPAGMLAFGAVVAFNATDLSIGEKSNIVQTGAPEPSTGLTIQAGNKRAVIGWEPSASAGITGYNVFYGTSADKSGQVLLTEEPLSPDAVEYLAITSLENPILNGVRYYFWVSATRGATESAQAGPISAVPFNIPPSASFTTVPALPYTGSPGDAITFNSTSADSDGVIVEYIWDFDGDGTPDESGPSLTTVQHTYSEEGMFEPRLTVIDDDGAVNTIFGASITIGVGIPVAVANAEPLVGNPPFFVSFSPEGSYDPDGTITEYAWKFFDTDVYRDYTEESGSASYEYTEPGMYSATLRVTDNHGKRSFASVSIRANAPPVAYISANPDIGNAPLPVDFDASSSYDPDGGSIATFEWDWTNDGTYDYNSGSNPYVNHTYNDAGTFLCKVRVTDNEGAQATDSIGITVTGGTATWHIETVDSSSNVGQCPSIALDSNNQPHISYLDFTNKDLKYAYYDSSWVKSTVDSSGDTGYWTSIAIDSSDYPHISYFDNINGDLKYARWNGISWIKQTPDSTGWVGVWPSLELDSNGHAHISYYDGSNQNLKYALWNGLSWIIETVDSPGDVGYWTSLALDSNDRAHISYLDVTNTDLMYAENSSGDWLLTRVDSDGSVGYHSSVALTQSHLPCISYWDGTSKDLKLAKWSGSQWNIETVDSIGEVGAMTSLDIDSQGYLHISYLDSTNIDLKYAMWNGTTWNVITVDSADSVGEYTSLAVDLLNRPHIAYYDTTNGDLKYAWSG